MPLPRRFNVALALLLIAFQPQVSEAKADSHRVLPTAFESQNDKSTDRDEPDKHEPIPPQDVHDPVLWHDPGTIAAENLFYGQGGKQSEPVPPFQFLDED